MLTDLQRRVRGIVARLPESGSFALAGGAALIASGVVERFTGDLDFFAPYPHNVDELLESAHGALEADGLAVTRLRSNRTFARLRIDSDTDSTYVDLATDYRLMPAIVTDDGAVLAADELAADKVLALAGRAAARDYLDFQALATRYGIDELCGLAASKDLGFTREQLAAALAAFDRIEASDFNIDSGAYNTLRISINSALRQINIPREERSADRGAD